ncbi:Protein PNS1 [Rhodotorula toruloides]|nr:Protein PNS1 [Rhodotorula toruloides]
MVTRESPYPPAGTVQQPPASYAPPQMSQAPNYAGNGGYGNSNGYGGYSGGQQYQPPDQAGGGYGYGGGNQAQEYYQQSQGAGGQKPPPQAPPPQNGAGMEGKFDDVKPKFNDVIFALLFLAQLGAFIAISVISLRALPASEGSVGLGQSGGTATTLNASTAWLLAIISGTALVLSILLLVLVRLFTKIILELCLLLAVAMSIGYAVYMWVERYWSGAIIFTIFAVISILAYPGMRRRIPFSKALLLFVIRVAKFHPSVYVIALIGTTLTAAYSAYWAISVVAIYQKWSPNAEGASTGGGTPSSGAVIGLMVFAVFNLYYTTQFLTYYGGRDAKMVAWEAFKRASTYSFGSIAFGSLIILQSYESGQGDVIGAAVACVAQCCVGCIAWAVEYFNRYAYVSISLYGEAYIPAAKQTWSLFRDRGITALINDCLVSNIWTFGSYAVGGLASLFAYTYVRTSQPGYTQDNSGLVAVLIGYVRVSPSPTPSEVTNEPAEQAFAIGFFICHSLGYAGLSSGVSTVFVALAHDPEVLAERDPELFAVIRQTYPHVVNPV